MTTRAFPAYARNLADGHGFVSQPGRPPRRGLQQPAGCSCWCPLFVVRLFEPVYVVKILGAALVSGASPMIPARAAAEAHGVAPGLLACALAASSPPLVIWSVSGLENGLTLALTSALYMIAVERAERWELRSGAVVGLLGATHPGGLVMLAAGPALAAIALLRGRQARAVGLGLRSHAIGAALVLGPVLMLRLAVFGRPLPHTYYAKRMHATFGDRLAAMAGDPDAVAKKLTDLCEGALGKPGPYLLGITLIIALLLAARRALPRHAGIAVTLWGITTAGYLFIDEDWMGEHRFGTSAILLSILALVTVLFAAARALGEARLPRRAVVAMSLALVAVTCALSFPRLVRFAEKPPTPFADVDRSLARKLDAYAGALGRPDASVLLPDVGAMLYRSHLTVYDAAGLCEPDVIRTLKRDTPVWLSEHPLFYDHVFERLRPTFISTHHFWTFVAAFDDDPRFDRDYVAIDAYEDPYVKRVFGRTLRSGDFVRRDALPDAGALFRLRAAYRPAPRPDPLAVRLTEALARDDAKPQTAAELIAAAREAMFERDDPQRAASLFARAQALHPSNIDAARGHAEALDAAVRPDEARRAWGAVLDLSPEGSPAAFTARARLAGLPRTILAP
ncbi:MAG: hypothetical protein R3B70_34100 [Polyangiaceae bacterium]